MHDPATTTPPEITRLKDLHRSTPLVRDGTTRAILVAPSSGRYDPQATRIRDAIADASGVRIPIVAASAPAASIPIERHAIVLGNRGTNAAIARLYDRYRTMLDANYPGAGGHVLRSVHDPFGNGTNVVLVGGSDDAGVERATDRLLHHLEAGTDGDSSVTLGWLQDIEVSPAYDLPEVGEASATVPHWDQSHGMAERNHNQFGWNALSRNMALYFMTGEERYAEEFLRLRAPDEEARDHLREWDGRGYQDIADPLSNLMHYNHHKTVLLWDLIEESPVFTEEQRLAVTRSLRAEYENRLGEEFYGLSEPAHDVGGRHQQFEALAQLVLARYFRRSYPDEFWERAYAGAANVFRALHETSQLGVSECENMYFYPSYFQPSVDYMLLTGDREPMDAGTMPKLLDGLEALHSGRDRHWSLATCALNLATKIASLTGEDHWLGYREDMAMDTDQFRVGQSFWSGEGASDGTESGERASSDLEATLPEHLVGEWSVNRMAHQYWAENFDHVPEDEAFLWASWRSRADAGGDFVLLDGHDGGGRNRFHRFAIPELRIDGQTILQGDSWTNLGHFNQVRTLADGVVGPGVCTAAALADRGHLGDTAFAVGEVEDTGCAEWRRTLAQRVGRFAVVADEVTATRDAENFEIRTAWQGYDATWNDDERALELPDRGADAPVGRVRFCDPVEVRTDGGTARMIQRFEAATGDRTINVSLLHSDVETPEAWSCRRVSPNTVAMETPEPTVVTVAGEDADVAVREPEHFFGLGVGRWEENGEILFTADRPVAVDWDMTEQRLVVRADEPTRITYRNGTGDLAETTVEGERTVTGAGLAEEHRVQVRDSLAAVVEDGKRAWSEELVEQPGPTSATPAIEPAWERAVDGSVEIVEHVTIDGESRWLVGAEETVHVLDSSGETVATLAADAAVCAVHYWPEAAAALGEPVIVTGHMDQEVHAWHPDGERAWSYRTRMTEETLSTGQDQWFHDARPGVHGLADHPDFGDDGPTLFVGSACTLELLDPSGEPARRIPIFWGIPRHFTAIEEPDGTTAMAIGKNPGDEMAAAILREDDLDPTETRFSSVPEGHAQVSNWGSIVRQGDRYVDLDGDGDAELVGALTGYWNRVTAWEPDGTAVANAQFGPGEGALQQGSEHDAPNYRLRDVAVTNRDADARSEVLVATRDGYLVALTHDLDRRWSRYLGDAVEAVVTVPGTGDHDGQDDKDGQDGHDGHDGQYRIVAGTRDGTLAVLDHAGTIERRAELGGAVCALDADESIGTVGVGTDDGQFAVFSIDPT